jgi:hypothetical protein
MTTDTELIMKKKKGTTVFGMIAVVAFLGGCNLFGDNSDGSSGSGSEGDSTDAPASLTISVADGRMTASGYDPGISLDVAEYRVSGSGPAGATFTEVSLTVDDPTHTVADMVTGEWTIAVDAYNGDAPPSLVGAGTSTTTLSPGASSSITVSVADLSDPGTLNLQVNWPAEATVSSFTATVTPTDGSGIPSATAITLTGDNPAVTGYDWSSLTNLGPGFYQLSISLEYGDRKSALLGPETVRIASGATTAADVTITAANLEDGSLVITIDDQTLGDTPFGVTVADQGNGTATAAITHGEVGDTYTYRWFVDGILVEAELEGAGTATLDISDRNPGRYNVSVIVSDGTHLDSDSIVLTVPVQP